MLFSVGLVTSLLLTAAVQALAYPRSDEHRASHVLVRANDVNIKSAGAEYVGDGQGVFTDINATFNVPHVTNFRHPFSVKIGFDDVRCRDAYIHVGVEITPDQNGQASYRGYYLWHPKKKGYFERLSVSAGHDITFWLGVTRSPSTLAAIIVRDEHSGTSDSVILTDPSANAVCAEDAILLVQPDNHNEPIANFGRVVFKNIIIGATYEYLIRLEDLVQEKQFRAKTEQLQGGTVYTVTYV